ncbi:MAG: hypothetical protein PHV13_02740 [Candidatus ainarchaeum sp.]|nr:hypothetical protein [Candidatus ainarchaeum sp.]
MRALTMRTIVKRPEAGMQKKPCLDGVLHEGPARMPKPPSTNHHIQGGRLPKAYLDSHSMWRRCYYAKNRTARGYSARNAEAAICGMRWNYYVSFGKHIHLAAAEERHANATTGGHMRNVSHNTATENANEVHEYRYACAAQDTGVAQAAGSTYAMAYVMQGAPAYGQMAQAPAGGTVAAAENCGCVALQAAEGNARPASYATQGSVGAGNTQQAGFSVHVPQQAGASPAGHHQHHWHATAGAAWQGSGAPQAQRHMAAQLIPISRGASSTSIEENVRVVQMDITLSISYNPLSQLSYTPTYQVGIYSNAQAVAAQPAADAAAQPAVYAATNWSPAQLVAAEATAAAVSLQAAVPAAQQETGYIGSTGKKQFMLKVAHADAIPE